VTTCIFEHVGLTYNRKMRSFIIGCSIVSVALWTQTYGAMYPYMSRVGPPALPGATVADRSLPPVMIDSDREKLAQSPRLVATDSQTGKVITSPPVVADPRQEKAVRSKSAVTSIANRSSPSQCGPGLVAQDLAGECRAKPCPTMGALEALGASTAPNARPTCTVVTNESNINSYNKQGKKPQRKTRKKKQRKI